LKNIFDKIKYGSETVKNPLYKNKYSYGKIIQYNKLCNNCRECVKVCATDAIEVNCDENHENIIRVNNKKCIYCRNCINICKQNALKMTSDYKMSELELMGNDLRKNIYSIYGRSLALRSVDTGSCNACMSELSAMRNTYYDISRFGINIAASPRHADGILVTGPVTINMKEALEKTYYAMAEPRLVIAVGSCSYDGGIFKEAYGVYDDLKNILPVDLFIPGCPPSPQAIIFGLLSIMGKV
jgi:hydrogenase-4 component I